MIDHQHEEHALLLHTTYAGDVSNVTSTRLDVYTRTPQRHLVVTLGTADEEELGLILDENFKLQNALLSDLCQGPWAGYPDPPGKKVSIHQLSVTNTGMRMKKFTCSLRTNHVDVVWMDRAKSVHLDNSGV